MLVLTGFTILFVFPVTGQYLIGEQDYNPITRHLIKARYLFPGLRIKDRFFDLIP